MADREASASGELAVEQARLGTLAAGVRSGLARSITDDGVLIDGCLDAPAPDDHYASVFLGLALQTAGEKEVATRVLDRWGGLSRKRRGHEPFNRLGLGLMATLGQPCTGPVVAKRHAQCPLRRYYPSNNWALLAQALRVREVGSDRSVRWHQRRLVALVRRWTTTAGGFIDFPRWPDPERGIATPTAYHLKSLLCLHLALGRGPQPELESALARGLDWLGLFLTDAGYCGGLGRSNHALFGDACLLAVLHGLLRRPGALQPDAAEEVLRVARNIRQRLEHQRREDGLLWLTPGGGCGEAAGWDGYMFLSVYNAWFAGLLSATLKGHPWLTGTSLPEWTPAWNPEQGIHEDREAGLLRFRGERVDAQISMRGQAIQGFGRAVVDLRQAAVCPFHVEVDGRPVVAPPVRTPARALNAEPAMAGWTPVVESAGELFGLTRLESLSVEPTDSGVGVTGSGAPVRLTRAPERTILDRLTATVDWRLLGGRLGRQQGVRPDTLPAHPWAVQLTIDDREGTVHYQLRLQPPSGRVPVRWLNPGGTSRLATPTQSSSAARLSTLGPAAYQADPPAPWPNEGANWEWTFQLTDADATAPEKT